MKKIRTLFLLILSIFFLYGRCDSESTKELPRPDFYNTFFLTTYYPIYDIDEIKLIKSHFPDSLYKRFGISKFVGVKTSWKGNDIKGEIKRLFESLRKELEIAKELETRMHFGFTFGFARSVSIYNDAKKEDIRNCQWYNDGKLASDYQLKDIKKALNSYIWLSMSRYAFDLREQLKKVSLELGRQLALLEMDYPDTFIAASGPGEAELNYNRIVYTNTKFPVTDYSPFAVLEFRDWILHKGLYDDNNGKYKGQGYKYGGKHYWGEKGLKQFNLEFGTDFKTWDLKYYNWSIKNYNETKIPWDSIPDKGGLSPSESSPYYIEGGFDPPREINENSPFWRLWNRFRQEMVRNYVNDIARWVYEGGFQSGRWYSHQIPADYLWGNSPELGKFEHRLETSASPLWTSFSQPYGNPGVTCYDIKFPSGYFRTTQYLLPFFKKSGYDWAILEYDPATIAEGSSLTEDDIGLIYNKYKEAYDSGAHLIAAFSWKTGNDHLIKGTKKLDAIKKFWNSLKDLPWNLRKTDGLEFYPPSVKGLEVAEDNNTYILNWSDKVWYGLNYKWNNLNEFSNFIIYCKKGNKLKEVGKTQLNSFTVKNDECSLKDSFVIQAVFKNGLESERFEEVKIYSDKPYFAENRIYIKDEGINYYGFLRIIAPYNKEWKLKTNKPWISFSSSSGEGDSIIRYNIKECIMNEFCNVKFGLKGRKKSFIKEKDFCVLSVELLNSQNIKTDTLYFIIEK